MRKLSGLIATLGFTGHIPYAPGTFGSALAFIMVLLLRPGDSRLSVILAAVFILGVYVSHQAEKEFGKDSGHIVIDEFCGYLISVLFVPRTGGYLFAAFVLFRFFDILKPPPIRGIERTVPGGVGIMSDDAVAGIYTNICLQVWRYFF